MQISGIVIAANWNATGATETFTNAALLNVTRTINITSQPTSTTGAIGGTRTFGVAGNTSDNDAGDITYQWQRPSLKVLPE